MTDDRAERDPLETIASKFIERQRKGEQPTVSEYAAKHPDLADEIRTLFPTIGAIERLKTSRKESSSGGVSLGGPPPERLGDYRIIREIGRGGMGIVYEAEQESLGRRVAIKVLPKQSLLDAKHLERFEREARFAAGLHHTNIVEVFGVGEQDGFHYYVMQSIQGVGLDAVIRRLACRDSEDVEMEKSGSSGGTGLDDAEKVAADHIVHPLQDADGVHYWQWVARIGRQVAEALHHAHLQGTLHRDIKPANLIIDAEGAAWITDFGLATAVHSEKLAKKSDLAGTLRYMPPEQFEGKAEIRSDVYSLGLTLYELLTWQPAYDNSDRTRLERRIKQERPVPPHKIKPRVPRDLEAIVFKAIVPDPDQRYPSAGALAADLERFLDDRPVQARRIRSVERFWRWCRRNRAVAFLAGTSLLLLLLVAVVATVGYWRTKKALQGEESERRKAEANAGLAIEALDRFFERYSPGRIGVSTELAVEGVAGGSIEAPSPPVLSREAAALLEDMLPFYDRLAGQAGNIKELRLKAAAASRRIGDIRQSLGQYSEAAGAYHRVIKIYQELGMKPLERRKYQIEIARIRNELGRLYRSTGRTSEARKSHLQALTILQGVFSGSPALPEIRYELARTSFFLGTRDRPPPGLGPRGPGQGPPGQRKLDRRRGEFRDRQAPRSVAGDREEKEHLAKAIALLDELVEQFPSSPDYKHLLGLCHLEGPPGAGRGRKSRAEALDRAVTILEGLVKTHPDVPDYQYDLGEAYMKFQIPRPPVRFEALRIAETRLRKALSFANALVTRHPFIFRYLVFQARIHHRLGDLHRHSRCALQGHMSDKHARVCPASVHGRMTTSWYKER